ncbi:HS12B-like protein [Mya arenaria]|uniref:HS12B-like protein n=1 Tax=Mya arenaria TaxID=6604 RepID=A0ABY7DM30_MYAAR|nr:HS12B-like protein [Mya arenaria]
MERSSSSSGFTVSTETTWQDKLIVAAIDFGTTYSGFALSFHADYRQDKTSHIYLHNWSCGGTIGTAKTPTAVLLKPDTSFDSFGYEAENRFLSDNIEDDAFDDKSDHSEVVNPETWYFFRHFKMKLYGNKFDKPITLDSTIPDERGRELPAILAGIPYDHLRIALEPECAAVYMLTKEIPSLSSSLQKRFSMNEGDSYIVADLGGGTLDIAAHQINMNRKCDEIMIPDGGPSGGNNINYKFEQFLVSVSGAQAFLNFKKKYSQDYLYLMRDFEHKKYGFPGDAYNARVTLRMPLSFFECHREENQESFQDSVRQTPFSQSVFQRRETLTIEDKLVEVMEKLSKRYNIKALFCVGGFSDCGLVKEKVQAKFSCVIIPAEAIVAIMKGAVIYGRDETTIETRLSKYTFGLDWNEDFDPKVHPESKREHTDDGYMCKDIFKVIAKANDSIPTNKPTKIMKSYVKTASQTAMEFPFYRTLTDPPPMFVDDQSCTFMGSMKVSLDDTTGGMDRFVTLKVFLGATTLRAEAVDKKGRTHRVNFLLGESQV